MVAIVTRLALRDTGKYLNPEEAKAPEITKMGQSGTVVAGTFRCRDEGGGQEGEIELHISRLLGQ